MAIECGLSPCTAKISCSVIARDQAVHAEINAMSKAAPPGAERAHDVYVCDRIAGKHWALMDEILDGLVASGYTAYPDRLKNKSGTWAGSQPLICCSRATQRPAFESLRRQWATLWRACASARALCSS